MTSQLPARLENHVARLQELLPACSHPELKQLLTASAESKAGVLEVAHDWALLDTSSQKGAGAWRQRPAVTCCWVLARQLPQPALAVPHAWCTFESHLAGL